MLPPLTYRPNLNGLTWNYERRNIVYCADWLDVAKSLPDKSVNLIIADPPYFEVKGAFDFVWDSFDEYLKDVERWAVECKRILADNGSLYWFGPAKKIAYSQVILDKYFGLLNNLVWENTNPHKQQIRFSPELRSYGPITERVLFYSNDVYNLTQCVYSIRDYIRAEILRAKGLISLKAINSALGTATNGGGVASACLSLKKSEPTMFTKEMYQRLQAWLNTGKEYEYLRKEYEELRKEYEELRKEYEELRRPFSNTKNLGDVWHFEGVSNNGQYGHDTVKPDSVINAIIETSSRPGDFVFVPFAGSGTECAMAIKLGREVIGAEIDSYHCQTSNLRVSKAKAGMQPRTEAEVKAAGGQMALFDQL